MLFQILGHAGDGGSLLTDGNIDAQHILVLLVPVSYTHLHVIYLAGIPTASNASVKHIARALQL